jgi:hypothetical protein
MVTEEERLARLRRTLHSLATLVPKIILTRVDRTYPVLRDQAVSAMHPVKKLYHKCLYHNVSQCKIYVDVSYSAKQPY